MRKNVLVLMTGAAALGLALLLSPRTQADDKKVDFAKDVQPILSHSCVKCHGADPQGKKPKGKYDLTTKEGALKGGENKTDIVPGKAAESLSYKLLLGPVGSGDDEIGRMPYKKDPLPKEKIDILKAWIDQGAEWPDGVEVQLAK